MRCKTRGSSLHLTIRCVKCHLHSVQVRSLQVTQCILISQCPYAPPAAAAMQVWPAREMASLAKLPLAYLTNRLEQAYKVKDSAAASVCLPSS